jgi:hypothetical protein
MVNVVVDFVLEVVQDDVSANVISNVNSNCVKAEVARGMDVEWNVELVLDASVYGVGEGNMSGGGNS